MIRVHVHIIYYVYGTGVDYDLSLTTCLNFFYEKSRQMDMTQEVTDLDEYYFTFVRRCSNWIILLMKIIIYRYVLYIT